MPTITAQGKTFQCKTGANLRQVLMENGVDLYSSKANYVNCMGIGTCGTCAVEIKSAKSTGTDLNGAVSEVNWRDMARRSLPPHDPSKPLRLACQTKVLDDIRVTKYNGFWGHQETVSWTADGNA